MKTAAQLKKFFKETLKVTNVRAHTSSGKSQWQTVKLVSYPVEGNPYAQLYKEEIPFEFRKFCLKIIYPSEPDTYNAGAAGNVRQHYISMLPHEWDKALAEYTQPV